MINFRGKTIIIRTDEEYEKILKEGRKQGFTWKYGNDLHKANIHMPFTLIFKIEKKVIWGNYISVEISEDTYEASYIINEDKENAHLSAFELIKFMNKFHCETDCKLCSLSRENTKCKKDLCNFDNWIVNNAKELIEIAKRGETTVKKKSKHEEAIDTLNDYIDSASNAPSETDFYKALKLAVEALKEVNKKEL